MQIDAARLADLEARAIWTDPAEVLAVIHEAVGPRAAILSSMQRAGTVLCHMANLRDLSFDVLFVDTGLLHQETLKTRDLLASTHRSLNVRTLEPSQTFAEQTAAEGVLYLTQEGQERCCDLRKSAPLLAVRGSYDVLISALRRSEGGARSKVPLIDIDEQLQVLRVHPLATFSDAELDRYEALHPDVVKNPLHSMGFPTIGCFPCTTPVRSDEGPRDGRWRHLADVRYCGINPTDRGAGEATLNGTSAQWRLLEALSR